VDDLCAKDEMQRMLIGMAIAKDKNGRIFTVDEAIQYFREGKDLKEKAFLVAKDPDVYLRLVKGGVNIKSINVGGMYYKPGRKQFTKSIYADEAQIRVFKELQALGVKSEIRTSPKDKSIDLYTLC
jgi:mannose/fructose/N-acetylgalactosamine-specific phosphotransferase system component IIB